MKARLIASMARLPPRILALCMIGTLLIVAALMWIGLRAPLQALRTMHAERARLEMTATDSTAQNLQNRKMALEIATLERELAKLNTDRRASNLLIETIAAVDRAATRHGVALSGAVPGAIRAALIFEEIPFDIEARGGYNALVEWMADIERTLPTLSIVRFEIHPGEAAAPLSMKIRIAAYRLPEGKP